MPITLLLRPLSALYLFGLRCHLAQAATLPIDPPKDIQVLTEHIVLDNSDDSEIVISNNDFTQAASFPPKTVRL